MVRHSIWSRPRYLRCGIAVEHGQLLTGVEIPILAAHQRFGEEHRIVDDGDHGEKLAVTRPMLGHGAHVTAGNPITTEIVRLEMRGGDREHVAFPDTG